MSKAPVQERGSLGSVLLRPRAWLAGQPVWTRYTLALAVPVVATGLRLSLERYLATESPFLLYYPAVFLSVFYLGFGPGLLSLALCGATIGYYFAPEKGWLELTEPVDVTDLVLFLGTGGAMALLVEAQSRARVQSQRARRQAEEYAARLEQEIGDRHRAEEALKKSNEDLEDFVHIVSHDLKEPLRGLTMTAQFLREDYGTTLPREGVERLDTLVKLPVKLAAMLDALLDYSRVWRGDLGVKETDLSEVVSEVVESLGPWLKEQHASVEVRALPTVRCDRVRVAQVFSNLITNGVKYNESARKRVEVGARGGVLFVKDNGIGIAPEHSQQVFRMFRRLHRPESFGGGTGSGLALVKKTVERHGGKVWVESRPGEGATFCFTLSALKEGAREACVERAVS